MAQGKRPFLRSPYEKWDSIDELIHEIRRIEGLARPKMNAKLVLSWRHRMVHMCKRRIYELKVEQETRV